jgi:cysteine desulfurase
MQTYFDHNATTPIHPDVFESMKPYLLEHYGNASCIYQLGVKASYAVEKARIQVASLIGANESEIVFTSGGTESDNHAILGTLLATGKKHIITLPIEHPAVLQTCQFVKKYHQYKVTYLHVDRFGFIDIEELQKSITPDTALVSIMTANNEIGTIQPMKEISRICREHAVLFHTDAVQAAGKISVDVNEIPVDLLSLSAHKIYGPKGVGATYIRNGTPYIPHQHGGGQENGRRGGTENVPGIVGFGTAAVLAKKELQQRSTQERQLRDYMREKLDELPVSITWNSPTENCLPGTANFSLLKINSRDFVREMDKHGFYIATGSACSTGKLEPSHVIKAIGRNKEEASSSIRISLGYKNTREEIDRFIEQYKFYLE